MITVVGRILPPPDLMYGQGKKLIPRFGTWNINLIKLSRGATISKWTVFSLTYGNRPTLRGNQTVGGAMRSLADMMKTSGLQVEPPLNPNGSTIPVSRDRDEQMKTLDASFKFVAGKGIEMLMIILPDKSASLYATVKYLGDVRYGIHTICCQAQKLTEKPDAQYLANVALKWNLKRGGVNHSLSNDKLPVISQGKTMLVGMDVTHPSPGSTDNAPSVAGVAASVKPDCAQWPATVRAQTRRAEMVEAVQDMIESRMKLWAKNNAGAYPANIILYRDGVSEGQYQQVLTLEVPAIEQAAKKLYNPKDPKVKITVVVCGKRHHTRFYPTTLAPGDTDGRSHNPLSGTIVDRGVTSEKDWDFFLQAHQGLQGTAKPAHYIVLRDDLKLGAQQIETIVSTSSLRSVMIWLTCGDARPIIFVISLAALQKLFLYALRHTMPILYASEHVVTSRTCLSRGTTLLLR